MINFEQYDRENPEIWQAFVHFTVQTIGKGFTRYSAKGIAEIIRWHTGVNGNTQFKIDNNYTADYARKFTEKYPQHKDFFATRNLRAKRVKST